MIPEIIIHIGLHKTGTTSLQIFCAANESIFNRSGVFFPKATRERKPGQIIHSNLSWELMKHDMFDPQLGTLDGLLEEIRSRTDVRKWLITGEGLSRLKDPAAFISRFHPHPVTVIAYIRDPVEAAPSLYTEHLKAGSDLTFDQWIKRRAAHWLDRGTMMKPWCRAGLTLTGRILDHLYLPKGSRFQSSSVTIVQRTLDKDSLHQGDLIRDMLQLLDLDQSADSFQFSSKQASNARISSIECLGLLFLNVLHQSNLEMNDAQKIKDRLNLRKAIAREFPTLKNAFESTPAQTLALEQLFHKRTGNRTPFPSESTDSKQTIETLINWLRNLKQNEYDAMTLDRAARRAAKFSRQQDCTNPFRHT